MEVAATLRREISARTILLRAVQALALAPVIAAAFVAALTAAASIPSAPIAKNLAIDRAMFAEPRAYAVTGRRIDVGTECLGMSFALPSAGAGDNAFTRAVRAPIFDSCEALLAHLDAPDAASDRVTDYARYWHGYAAISRPLLALLPYHDLRMLTFNTVALLFFALFWRLYRDFSLKFAFAVFLPFFFINYAGFFILWTKAVTWIVALVAALYFASSRRPYERDPLLAFFAIGAATAYFDWLTTPLFVFAFPAYIYFFYLHRRGETPPARAAVIRLLQIGGFFAVGYGGFWFLKFALAALVIGPEHWGAVFHTAAFRFRGAYETVTLWPGVATLKNFEAFKALWGPAAFIVFLVLPLARKSRRAAARDLVMRAPVYAILAISPFVWFEVLTNHSQIHGLYTHANLVLFFLPLSLVLFGETARLAAPQPVENGVSKSTDAVDP